MKFFKGIVEPMYVICSSTKFVEYCFDSDDCGRRALKSYYVDSRYTDHQCSPSQIDCGGC